MVRAGLVERAADWPWSSASALLGLEMDGITETAPVLARIPDIAALLESEDEERTMRLRKAESVGRPIGSAEWIKSLEERSGRALVPGKRGRRKVEINALSP